MSSRSGSDSDQLAQMGPLIPARPIFGHVLLSFWAAALALSAAASLIESDALFLVFGTASCAIVTLPLLSRQYDLLSPWSFIVVAIYIGCGLRSLFVSLHIDGGRTIDELFLLGRGVEYFTWPSMLFIAGLVLVTTTYIASSKPVTISDRVSAPWVFNRAAPMIIAIAALIGAAAFLLYTQRTGGLSLSTLSAKRTRVDGLDLQNYESQGTLAALCDLSSYAFWMATALAASVKPVFRLFSARGAALAALFANAAAYPIYASIRADAGYILIIGVVIYLCLSHGKLIISKTILRGAFAVVVLVSALTLLRTGSGVDSSDFSVSNTVGGTFVYNRNFTDIPTSAQIIRAVPDVLEPAYGSTYTAWLVAWVPRSMWPQKPLISSGPVVGVRVFNTAGSGVRPGFIPEAYWNFGVPGVFVGCVLLGLGLRRLYELSRPRLSSPFWVVLYCGAGLRFGASIFSVGVGYAVFGAVLSAAGLIILMSLSGGARRDWPVSS